MTDRDQIIEAMARAASEAEQAFREYDQPCEWDAATGFHEKYRFIARAVLAAAEAAGMRFVGAGEAVVPRKMTKAMRRKAELCFTVGGVWDAAVAEAEKDQ